MAWLSRSVTRMLPGSPGPAGPSGPSTSTYNPSAITCNPEWASHSLAMTLSGVITTHALRVVLIRLRGRPQTWRGLAMKLFPWLIASGLAIGSAVSWSVICWAGASESEMAMYSATGGEYAYLDMVTRGCFFAGVWVALYFGFHFYREHREGILEREKLQTAAREAQLHALRAQLNPHFLFNSLNVIRAMVPAELPKPRQAVTSLSDRIRLAVHDVGAEPELAHEMAVPRPPNRRQVWPLVVRGSETPRPHNDPMVARGVTAFAAGALLMVLPLRSATAPVAAQSAESDATLQVLLERAGRYLLIFEERFSGVVTEERYQQEATGAWTGGSPFGR